MRIAIVTGASSGMGREMAVRLNDLIPKIDALWLIGRRMDRLMELNTVLDKPARLLQMDLGSEKALDDYRSLLAQEQPEILFLVNAAGFGKLGAVAALPQEELCGMVDLNVRALTELTRASLPYMAKKSRIINFASAAAFVPQPYFAVYAATKSYVLSFTRALNEELRGSGCFATAVCPGPVKTEFFDIAETTAKVPLYKYLFMADPKRVVKLALVDSLAEKDISVYGPCMKCVHVLGKLMPSALIFWCLRLVNEGPGQAVVQAKRGVQRVLAVFMN